MELTYVNHTNKNTMENRLNNVNILYAKLHIFSDALWAMEEIF